MDGAQQVPKKIFENSYLKLCNQVKSFFHVFIFLSLRIRPVSEQFRPEQSSGPARPGNNTLYVSHLRFVSRLQKLQFAYMNSWPLALLLMT